jgi:hypothetical protein
MCVQKWVPTVTPTKIRCSSRFLDWCIMTREGRIKECWIVGVLYDQLTPIGRWLKKTDFEHIILNLGKIKDCWFFYHHLILLSDLLSKPLELDCGILLFLYYIVLYLTKSLHNHSTKKELRNIWLYKLVEKNIRKKYHNKI